MKFIYPVKKTILASALVLISMACNRDDDSTPAPLEASPWEYEHTDWQTQGYPECAGKVQSPVNIETSHTVSAALHEISFDYEAFPLTIIDNGYTLEVEGHGHNTIEVNGTQYTFKQFHFHHESEHSINGEKSAMELHLVHEDLATGNLAVVGVFLQPGSKHAQFEQILDNLPTQKKKALETDIPINLQDWLPASKNYYTYVGSLTTPPCKQGIQWFLMKEPVNISEEQINIFAKKYSNNARPIQSLNGRIVFEK
jgi:carbonic anhydrase